MFQTYEFYMVVNNSIGFDNSSHYYKGVASFDHFAIGKSVWNFENVSPFQYLNFEAQPNLELGRGFKILSFLFLT